MDLGEIGGEGSCRAEGEPSWENLMDSDNESMTSEESEEDLPWATEARGDSSSESSSDEGPKKQHYRKQNPAKRNAVLLTIVNTQINSQYQIFYLPSDYRNRS
jgi:hypothetical protein